MPGTTKNDKGRAVVMADEVHKLVSECIKGKKAGDSVFTWANGKPVTDFRRTWRTLAKKAEMPDLIFHDLRRSAVRNMVRAGISKHVAKRISGHQTDSIFDRYDIHDTADLAEAARKLEARNGHNMGTPETAGR
jgi:integrase